jgi:hypothetical protein
LGDDHALAENAHGAARSAGLRPAREQHRLSVVRNHGGHESRVGWAVWLPIAGRQLLQFRRRTHTRAAGRRNGYGEGREK